MVQDMRSMICKLASCVLMIGSIYWYAATHFYRDPGSAFFDSQRAFVQRYSRYRTTEVNRFVDTSNSSPTGSVPQHTPEVPPTLCVALSSVRRNNSQYLETTVGSLLHGLSAEERADLHVKILIADTEPEHHPAWHRQWIWRAVDEVHTYIASNESLDRLKSLENTGAYSEKGVYDYSYAMRLCSDTGASYVGMFEDDILLADGWLIRTLLGLRHFSSHNEHNLWLFMRLFNQERSTGWATRSIGGNHELWIILAIALVVLIPSYMARKQYGWARRFLDMETLILIIGILNPALVILFFQCGKASLLPPKPGVVSEDFGCCSQALIFSTARVPSVLDYLHQKQEGQIDILLDDLARTEKLTRYALYPVQAQHIGLESARKTSKDEAQAIWSMTFEDLDADTLARKHESMIQEYYGTSSRTIF